MAVHFTGPIALSLLALLQSFPGCETKTFLPGKRCGTNQPIRRYKSVMQEASALECVLFDDDVEYQSFLQTCFDDWHSSCRQRIPEAKLTDRAGWKSFAEAVFQDDYALHGPANAYNGNDKGFHSTTKASFLQIELIKAYFVSRIHLECRQGEQYYFNNNFIESRVGMKDTSSLPLEMLTVNEVCYGGDSSGAITKDYLCPHPLRGKYLTFQKTKHYLGWAIWIDEVDVSVVNL